MDDEDDGCTAGTSMLPGKPGGIGVSWRLIYTDVTDPWDERLNVSSGGSTDGMVELSTLELA